MRIRIRIFHSLQIYWLCLPSQCYKKDLGNGWLFNFHFFCWDFVFLVWFLPFPFRLTDSECILIAEYWVGRISFQTSTSNRLHVNNILICMLLESLFGDMNDFRIFSFQLLPLIGNVFIATFFAMHILKGGHSLTDFYENYLFSWLNWNFVCVLSGF